MCFKDTISSDSDNDKEVEPQSLTRERSLEFEYEPLIANIARVRNVFDELILSHSRLKIQKRANKNRLAF